ncbi:hypothetical protein VNO78_26828 [Psophocarpus tetragonolobus]|uniref:Uncharacterized protein n=1 Tax=Psophocarpus tetragonolobus TaxID=3891 RepID=A0AAN9S0Q5_PSOTE
MAQKSKGKHVAIHMLKAIESIFWKAVVVPVCRTMVHQSQDDLILSLSVNVFESFDRMGSIFQRRVFGFGFGYDECGGISIWDTFISLATFSQCDPKTNPNLRIFSSSVLLQLLRLLILLPPSATAPKKQWVLDSGHEVPIMTIDELAFCFGFT